jgi:type IV pilus assembly protein PilM
MRGFGSQYPIGIDIGEKDIHALQLRPAPQGFTVRGLMHRELAFDLSEENGRDAEAVSIFREILKSGQFRGGRAVVHLPSQHIISFPITFQVGENEALEEVILREAVAHIPFPLEEAIIDYPSLVQESEGNRSRCQATVVAVRRVDISRYVDMLKQAGFTVEAVDFSGASLIRLHRHLVGPVNDTDILCHLGRSRSQITFVRQENILGQRIFNWGIQGLYDKLFANLQTLRDLRQVRVLLERHGLAYEDREKAGGGDTVPGGQPSADMTRAIHQIISPYMDEFVYECHKMITYVRSRETNPVFEGICIYGEGETIGHLDTYLERRLQIPVRTMDPMRTILSANQEMADRTEICSFALAFGLAIRKVSWL